MTTARNTSWQHLSADAVYNSPNRTMFRPSRLPRVCYTVLLLSQLSFAADWRGGEAQIAGKISAINGPGVIAVTIENRSSISSPDVAQIRQGIVAELERSGVRVWDPDQAAATVKVTLSENLEAYVWVAEVQQGANQVRTALISIPRPGSSLNPQSTFPLAIRATPILTQPETILDFALVEGRPRRALILSQDAIIVDAEDDGHWVTEQSVLITHPHPFPRDVRGRILLRSDHLFDAYLPGLICHSTSAFPLSMACQESDDPWPLGEGSGLSAFFAPARNFFTGALVPGIGKQKSSPAFYSAAAIPRDRYTLWLFSGTDGHIYMLDGINQQTASRIRWGSSIAGVHPACRTNAELFVTAPDAGPQDSLQVFELPDREPLAVSQKFVVNGAVTALWSGASPDTANLVVRNSLTGNYEAMQLTVACVQ